MTSAVDSGAGGEVGRKYRLAGQWRTSTIGGIGARYSRFVGFMKLVLPLSAAALVATVIAWPDSYHPDDGIQISLADLTVLESGKPGMERVRYVGTDDNNRPYLITAGSVREEGADNDHFFLHELQADITLEGGAWVTLMATTGTYRRDMRTLGLAGAVNIFSDNGLELHTASALVDLAGGFAEGDDPVQGQGPFGTLNANRFRLTDRGQRIVFEGNVRLVVDPRPGR